MSDIKFISFHIKRFRSLLDVSLNISDEKPVVICGENNIGKTNILRALNIYFNHVKQPDLFKPEEDIPHHIYYGSGGAGTKTELTGEFLDSGKKLNLKVTFRIHDLPAYTLSGKTIDKDEALRILNKFQFIFIESHNVDLPGLISVILEKEVLTPLDAKRKKQSQPLEKLKEFIALSESAISDIERDINVYFNRLTDFDGVLKSKKIRINFAEFEKLRDVVKTMTSITLQDGNDHGIASKGSGAQRAVFLSLMQFISQNSKKYIIWGVDEPEAFLQPRLQRKVFDVLRKVVSDKKQPMILTTHSQHFIDLKTLNNTHIFSGVVSQRNYTRKPGQTFFETSTSLIKCNSDFDKALLIKSHLGILNNDGWEVLPHNILVEGSEDKKYLESFMQLIEIPPPNIVYAGGASKIGGYLQYYDNFAKDLSYKPKFVCVFDNDTEGIEQAKRIRRSYNHIEVVIAPLPRFDGQLPDQNDDCYWEIEDFLPPQVMFDTINDILRINKYSIIRKHQISNRDKPANKDKQILNYAEECTNQNNPEKLPFLLDNDGRKMQICKRLCEKIQDINASELLTEDHIRFLKSLSK